MESNNRTVECPACGRIYEWDGQNPGGAVECECGCYFALPGDSDEPSEPESNDDAASGETEPNGVAADFIPGKLEPKTKNVKCPKCKHNFAESATERKAVCPQCGHVFDNISGREKRIGCMVLLGICLLFYLGDCGGIRTGRRSEDANKINAEAAAQCSVEDKLASPFTADKTIKTEHSNRDTSELYFELFNAVASQFRRDIMVQNNLRTEPLFIFNYSSDDFYRKFAGYIFDCTSDEYDRYYIRFYAGWKAKTTEDYSYVKVTGLAMYNGTKAVCLEITIVPIFPSEVPETLKW